MTIIAATAHGHLHGEGACRGAGRDAYMPKPLDHRTLYGAMDAPLTDAPVSVALA